MPETANRDPSTTFGVIWLPLLLATSAGADVDELCVSLDGAEEDNAVVMVGDVSNRVGGGGTPSTIESLRKPAPCCPAAGAASLSMVVSQATGSPVSAKTNLLLARRFNISGATTVSPIDLFGSRLVSFLFAAAARSDQAKLSYFTIYERAFLK